MARAIPRRLRASHDSTVKEQGSRTPGTGSLSFRMPVAWRPARFLRGSFAKPPSGPTPLVGRSIRSAYAAPLRPARSGRRRRDRDDPRNLASARNRQASKRTPEPWTTEPTSRDRLPSADASGVHGGSLGGGEFREARLLF